MGNWARKFLPKNFVPVLWRDIPAGPIRNSAEEQAQKTAALADALDHLATMDPDFVLPWLGATCPPGWELVAELDGKFLMGTDEAARDVGVDGGATSHTHTINHGHTGSAANESAHTHGVSADPGHNHDVTIASEQVAGGATDDVGSEGTYTTTTDGVHDHGGVTTAGSAHTHAITVDNHAGSSGSTDHLPPYVKVLFCRRKL